MSYGGYEYNAAGFGFDPMGYGGGFGGGMEGMGGGTESKDINGSASKPDKKASRERQSLLPLTIKQLHSIVEEDGTNKLDGVEVFTVRIVGTVLNTDSHATNVMYTISDGTGTVECKRFVEKDDHGSDPRFPDCQPHTLVRVNGNIRIYDGRKSLMIYAMTPIMDWNELTHHNLEIIHSHLARTRGPLQQTQQAGARSSHVKTEAHGQPQSHGNFMMGAAPGAPAGMSLNRQADNSNADPQKVLRDQILSVYRTTGDDNNGPNFQEVMVGLSRIGVNINMNQLMREVDHLSSEGQLYTTIDEHHYKSTV